MIRFSVVVVVAVFYHHHHHHHHKTVMCIFRFEAKKKKKKINQSRFFFSLIEFILYYHYGDDYVRKREREINMLTYAFFYAMFVWLIQLSFLSLSHTHQSIAIWIQLTNLMTKWNEMKASNFLDDLVIINVMIGFCFTAC